MGAPVLSSPLSLFPAQVGTAEGRGRVWVILGTAPTLVWFTMDCGVEKLSGLQGQLHKYSFGGQR